MDSETKIIIAFLFNRSGKTALTEAELYLPLSMELGWLSTKEAQGFVKSALQQDLLVKKDGLLHPNFSLEKITIPLNFAPSEKLFCETTAQEQGQPLINRLIGRICAQTTLNQPDIEEEITKEGKEKNLLLEVAALYVARKYDVDISDVLTEVEQGIFREKTR
jgi:hypothetical protein